MNVADIRKITAQLPPRFVIHGAEGTGKTTIASKFPASVFLQTEDGCPSGLEIDSFGPIGNFADLRFGVGALASEPHSYQTVVIDSLDATEELIWSWVPISSKITLTISLWSARVKTSFVAFAAAISSFN